MGTHKVTPERDADSQSISDAMTDGPGPSGGIDAAAGATLVEVKGLSMTFPGTKALDDVSFAISAGEVLAIVGHNGSGKSTLVKILAGIHGPDAGGEIRVRDGRGQLLSGDAALAELHFVHQNLGLIPALSAVENLDLGVGLSGRWMRPAPRAREQAHAAEVIGQFGASFDVERPVGELTPAERTIVALARALDQWTRSDHVLILDEPTAALHGEEVGVLFEAIRSVATRGAGVVFISHRLDEVMAIADRVIALRDGRLIANVSRGGFHENDLVRLIVGGDVPDHSRRQQSRRAAPVLETRGLRSDTLLGIDLDVSPGEIVGISGLLGSGREHILGVMFGARPRAAGDVVVGGSAIAPNDPHASIDHGIAFVPGDRAGAGSVATLNGRENLTLPIVEKLRNRYGALDRSAELAEAEQWFERFDIRPRDSERLFSLFSGGNQQKIVLAKCLCVEPSVLLLDEPTQGVDVGAKSAIYELIAAAAARGVAVVVSSSEAEELVTLCDRVIVLRDGRVARTLHAGQISAGALISEGLGFSETDRPVEATSPTGAE
jgi:ribose transport system ATP-binding protein